MKLPIAKDYLLYKEIYNKRFEQQDLFNANLSKEMNNIADKLASIFSQIDSINKRIDNLDYQLNHKIKTDTSILTIDSVMDDWIQEKELSEGKVTFLEKTYESILNNLKEIGITKSNYYYAEEYWLNYISISDIDLNEEGRCLEILCIASLLDKLKPIRKDAFTRVETVRPLIKKLFTPSEDFRLTDF